MELRHFIKDTITQIVDGIKDAQVANTHKGAIICPADTTVAAGDAKGKDGTIITFIDYEVGLTDVKGGTKDGGVGVNLALFSVGAKGKTDAQNTSVTNLKFKIPVVLPTSGEPKNLHKRRVAGTF